MEYYHNIKLTEQMVPMEAPEAEGEPDLEADLLAGTVDVDAIKAKRADIG
jgi:hypothetical protein